MRKILALLFLCWITPLYAGALILSTPLTPSIIPPPPSNVTATLIASPSSVIAGGSSTLTWTSANATSCIGTGFSTSGLLNGSVPVSPLVTTSYSLSCAGPGGPAIAAATVGVLTPGTVAWDASFVGANLSLDPTHLTATAGALTSYGTTRSTVSATTDLLYSEYRIDLGTGFYAQAVGVCNGSAGANDEIGGGGTNNASIGAFDVGEIYLNGVLKGHFNSFTTGDTVREVVNVNTKRFWAATNGGFWDNDPNADPVKGLGGIDISAISGALYSCLSEKSSSAATADFGATPLSGSVNWGTVPTTVTAHLTAGPSTVPSGDPVLLTWTSTNASACTGTGFLTGGAVGGTATVNPLVSTTYQIACSGSLGSANQSAVVTVGAGATYYVATTGNDANPGTMAAPWQTTAKVNSGNYAPGTQILFHGGQSWQGCLAFTPANDASPSPTSSPIVVGAYGSDQFSLTSTCTGDTGAILINGANAVTIQDCIVRPGAVSPRSGIRIENPTGSAITGGITVQRCNVGGFNYFQTGADFGAEIFITGFPGNPAGALTNINILDNTLHGLNGPSSIDENGIAGYGYGKNIFNVIYRGNTVYDIGGIGGGPSGITQASGNGIEAGGVKGGLIEYNVVHDIGGNTIGCGGPVGIFLVSDDNVIAQFNEAYRVQPINWTAGCDWDGYDVDIDATNSLLQYNYSHDNFGAGYLLYAQGTWGPGTVRYNISEHDDFANYGTTTGSLTVQGDGSPVVINAYNNTIWANSPGPPPKVANIRTFALTLSGTTAATGVIANNIFASTVNELGFNPFVYTNGYSSGTLLFKNNDWYQITPGTPNWKIGFPALATLSAWQAAIAGGDAGATIANPMLANGGGGGTCTWVPSAHTGPQPCPPAYALLHGSPLIGVGINLTVAPYAQTVGPRDYFGSNIPNGVDSGYNIGADGANR